MAEIIEPDDVIYAQDLMSSYPVVHRVLESLDEPPNTVVGQLRIVSERKEHWNLYSCLLGYSAKGFEPSFVLDLAAKADHGFLEYCRVVHQVDQNALVQGAEELRAVLDVDLMSATAGVMECISGCQERYHDDPAGLSECIRRCTSDNMAEVTERNTLIDVRDLISEYLAFRNFLASWTRPEIRVVEELQIASERKERWDVYCCVLGYSQRDLGPNEMVGSVPHQVLDLAADADGAFLEYCSEFQVADQDALVDGARELRALLGVERMQSSAQQVECIRGCKKRHKADEARIRKCIREDC